MVEVYYKYAGPNWMERFEFPGEFWQNLAMRRVRKNPMVDEDGFRIPVARLRPECFQGEAQETQEKGSMRAETGMGSLIPKEESESDEEMSEHEDSVPYAATNAPYPNHAA